MTPFADACLVVAMSGLVSWSFFEVASVRREMKLVSTALGGTMKLVYIEAIVTSVENGSLTDEAAVKRIAAVIRVGAVKEEAPKGAPEDGQT